MRLSPLRHTLAVLRTTIGLTQKEMADLVECSPPTIQAVELGKLNLSEKLGCNIALKTNVSLIWLMRNDVTQPPTDATGEPFGRDTYEAFQAFGAFDQLPGGKLYNTHRIFSANMMRLAAVCLRTYRTGELALSAYRLSRLFDELEESCAVTEEDWLDVRPSCAALQSAVNRKEAKELAAERLDLGSSTNEVTSAFYATIAAEDAKAQAKTEVVTDLQKRVRRVTKEYDVFEIPYGDGQRRYKFRRKAAGAQPAPAPAKKGKHPSN